MNTSQMLQIQLEESYTMLKLLVKKCPETLWRADNNGLPIWNQVIHALMGTEFWLREKYDDSFEFTIPLPKSFRDKLCNDEWCTAADGFMTKEETEKCFEVIDLKLEKFFSGLNDEMLSEKAMPQCEFTYLSVIVEQIRHIMCHIGMCNAVLLENGIEEVGWIAFGEE